MDNESQVIQRQMEETRSSLHDKLETLEQQVKNTVQDATVAVSDTVESVKEAVQETVDTVKDTVQGTVQSVKDTFDISQHVDDHPWAMLLGATAVGFVATRWILDAGEGASTNAPFAKAALPSAPHRNGGPQPSSINSVSAPAVVASTGSWIAEHYKDELAKVKGLAVGALGGLVREFLSSIAPPNFADQLKDVVNGVTTKMGGQIIDGPILSSFKSEREPMKGEENDYRHQTEMGRAMGATSR